MENPSSPLPPGNDPNKKPGKKPFPLRPDQNRGPTQKQDRNRAIPTMRKPNNPRGR